MGFELTGHVLRAPRQAPGNSSTSSEPVNGVVRDIQVPPARTALSPEVVGLAGVRAAVDLQGDQYRAAILAAPGTTPNEYLVWAANTSQVALVDDSTWWTSQGRARIPVGSFQVGNLIDNAQPFTDGVSHVVVTDDGGRDIGSVTHLVIARGDKTYDDDGWVALDDPSQGRLGSSPYEVAVLRSQDQQGAKGLILLQDGNLYSSTNSGLVAGSLLSVLGGGLSRNRGDFVVGVRYTVSPIKFWWTRNDRYETRFGWDGKTQRWVPYKGNAPVNLGPLLPDTLYTLAPKMRALPLGAVLPGDKNSPDAYSVIRVGSSPGALSLPVGGLDGTGILVVEDSAVGSFDFSGVLHAGVVGQFSGQLRFNPQFLQANAGKTIWYGNNTFSAVSNGVLGLLLGSDRDPLYLSPVPGPTDNPFIRISNRSPLQVTLVETEAALEAASEPLEGSCLVALSTGRLRLSKTDIYKADPKRVESFRKSFLGALVVYAGCSLNKEAQPLKAPQPLVQGDGVSTQVTASSPMYLLQSKIWPEDLEDTRFGYYTGLGQSGVLQTPDGTGAVPFPENVNPANVVVPVRPGGDSLPSPQSLGLVRTIEDGVGDTLLFGRDGAITEVVIVDRNSEIPPFPFKMPGGKAFISREATSLPGGVLGSRVQLSTADRKRFFNQEVFFLQASLTPSTYTTKAQILSKNRLIFRFEGTETFSFSMGGVAHTWSSSALPLKDFYTPHEVAESLQQAVISQMGTGVVRVIGDRIAIETSNPSVGVVEIGWGAEKDLSGCAALGFLPGWRAVGGKPNWLSDAGISLGVARSLLNLDRSKADADYRSQVRLEEATLQESVQPVPFVFLDYPPVEDIAGFDDNVFFNIQTFALQGDSLRIVDRRLGSFEDIQHRFAESKIAWLGNHLAASTVSMKTSTLSLGRSGVLPETLLGAPGIGGALYVAEDGGRFRVQELGVDFLLQENGLPGVANLVTRYGARVQFGAQGVFTSGDNIFTDTNARFLSDSNDPDLDPNTGVQKVDSNGVPLWLPILRPGYRLKIASGVSAGSYLVSSVLNNTQCVVTPAFVGSSDLAPWEAFTGIPDSLYDPAVVADVVYKPFNHLPEEPFKIRVLQPLGPISTNAFYSAFMADALTQNRPISLRFGGVHATKDTVALLRGLQLIGLGTLSNETLVLPQTNHVLEGAFEVVIGVESFVPLGVMTFSPNPLEVEYLTEPWDDGIVVHAKGELKFNSQLLEDLRGSNVSLKETFRDPSNLEQGFAEYRPEDGLISISSEDAVSHLGSTLYLVEQMITTGDNRDVAVSPLVGAVSFKKPLDAGSLVEMQYWLADNEGRRVGLSGETITEFLPLFVRREKAVRLTNRTFQVNAQGTHTWDTRTEPVVYIGPTLQNFGQVDFTIDTPSNLKGFRLNFLRDLPDWVTPEVTYAVFDALGGERSYTTSQRPVYRPPFYIKAGKDNFGLRGNRTGDFLPGQMLRIGAECFYITAIRYFQPSDVTRVDIYPSTVLEVGSRSPGNDVLTLVTSEPVTTHLFPDGASPVSTGARAGFMQSIPLSQFPFEPVNARQAEMVFQGNLTTFAVPGHILEVSGIPLTIAQSVLDAEGTRTKITFTQALQIAIDPRSNPTVKLSYRPIYPPEARDFVGVKTPVLLTEPVELVLFGEKNVEGVDLPGRTLIQGVEYSLDSETGGIQLLPPNQKPLEPGQRLVLSHTQVRTLEPYLLNGALVQPRWLARFLYNTVPTTENGFLEGRLTATYTFDNPDSFYFRTLPLRSYMAEALEQALDEMRRWQSPSSGPRLTTGVSQNNWDFGNLGLLATRRDMQDKDRAARAFLGFYNETILAFEQVEETITGEFIGDRSGKFRFWVGRGLEYAPPGYEDEITGVLNPVNVWATLFNSLDLTRDLTFLPTVDPLVVPNTSNLSDLILSGDPLGASVLSRMQRAQSDLIRNDIDDIILLGSTRPKVVKTHTPPWYTLEVKGVFQRMGLPHRMSRLYPTVARVLFTLQPGIGSDSSTGNVGVYAWRRTDPNSGEVESTYNEQIGQLSNPVLGGLDNTSWSSLQPRTARIRIWGYYPDGLPSSAFGAAINRPCMVVSAVPLSKTPINPSTGFPDPSLFLSQPPFQGDVPDAVAGDPSLALPGFVPGDKIALGKPDGKFLEAVYPEEVSVFGQKTFTGVFVDQILYGCVITFKNRHGEAIQQPNNFMVATGPNTGVPANAFGIGRADTLLVVPADVENPISDLSEAPSIALQQQASVLNPTYRLGFDLTVRSNGQVHDLSLPSWRDPFLFPLREISGQKTPVPMSHVEGFAEFTNTNQVPLNTPALLGEPLDDAGDAQIPYRKGTATELDRFDEIGNLLGDLMDRDVTLGGFIPDEVLFVDGEVVDAAIAWVTPSTLTTSVDVQPTPTFGVTPGRPGDFLLVQTDPIPLGPPQGWQGLLSVGSITSIPGVGSLVEPPRFVTQTNKGSLIRYHLRNYAVHTTPGQYGVNPQATLPPGVRLFEDTTPGNERVILSFQDVVLILNDGVTPASGNLNTILAHSPLNTLKVDLIGRPDNAYVNAPAGAVSVADSKDGRPILSISITSSAVVCEDFQGNIYGPFLHGGVIFGDFDPVTGESVPGTAAQHRHIIITQPVGGPVIPFTPTAGPANAWFLPHVVTGDLKSSIYGWEFALSVDCRGGGSISGRIEPDRLTFKESLDLEALSRPRGFLHSNGVGQDYPYQTDLRVTQVSLGSGGFSNINDVISGYLSFLNRTNAISTFAGGTWVSASSPDEFGSLKVMSFEDVNTPILLSGVVATVQTSQTLDSSGVDILVGNGLASHNWVVGPSGTPLDVSRVQKGDVVYIDRSDNGLPNAATLKAGTYIVRHAVQANAGKDYRAVALGSTVGSGGGFITTPFPVLTTLDVLGLQILVDDASMLPASGKLFVVLRLSDLDSSDPVVHRHALFSVDWVSKTGNFLNLGGFETWRWADDSNIGANLLQIQTALNNEVVSGLRASWHDSPVGGAGPSVPGKMTLGVEIRGGNLPNDSSVVGFNDPGAGVDNATYGFHGLAYNRGAGFANVDAVDLVSIAPASGEVQVVPATPWTNEIFDTTNSNPVYINVPRQIVIHISDVQGLALNAPNVDPPIGAGNYGVACILPGTDVVTETSLGQPAFYAQAGLFLEPSTPQQALPLGGTTPLIVDANYSMDPTLIGMRQAALVEAVHLEVRRVRRWHGKQNALNDAFMPLRFAYEVRRGRVSAYSRNNLQVGLVSVLSGTNLGYFDDPDVNIRPGDIFRVLDDQGVVLDEGVVSKVVSPTDLTLEAPGLSKLTESEVEDLLFEVYLRQAPVPHEQSNEQLLSLVTDRVIHRTVADRSDADPQNWVGGYVPETTGTESWSDVSNKLYDDSPQNVNFVSLGVRKNDIVIVDPAGMLPMVDEQGFRPLGDRSVPTRTADGGPSPYQPGQVSSLDDNRGFYRVVAVHEDHLEVSPLHTFAGGLGTDVILGSSRTNLSYSVYPTVSTSVLCVEGVEGQNDLRPTRKADNLSYQSLDPVEDQHSLRPFSYTIIRPTSMFSVEVVDTILMMRERMLTLIEMLGTVVNGSRGGFYWDWQDGAHISDLGTPTDPESGLGLFPNRLVVGLIGETSISPFCNNSTCMSLLDRRFWIQDTKLDSLEPDPTNPFAMQFVTGLVPFGDVGGPYTAYTNDSVGGSEVRPVLTDHLDLILDVRDRLRAIRYTWLTYRTHRLLGTLARIDQFDSELPQRLADRQRTLLLEASVEKVGT